MRGNVYITAQFTTQIIRSGLWHNNSPEPPTQSPHPAQEKFSSALPFHEKYRLLRAAEQPPGPKLLRCKLMAHTHQLPSVSGAVAPNNLTDDWKPSVKSSVSPMALPCVLFSGKTFEFGVHEDVLLLKVSPLSGRMSSFEYNAAPEGRDHDNRSFTVSVSLHRAVST